MAYEYTEEHVGAGWRPMVKMLLAICHDHSVSVTQIKEKFGGLRFYVGAAPEWLHDLIDACSAASSRICEFCGKPGKPNGKSWIKTTCPDHIHE